MAKKTEVKIEKIEREYIIPLREKCRPVPRYKKTPKAIKTIKEFLVKHMKIYDRDLKKIKVSTEVNEYLWFRGIKNPPHKVKIKAIKEGDIVRVELIEIPKQIKARKTRRNKMEKNAQEATQKKKTLMQKMKEPAKEATSTETKTEEQKSEDKTKQKANVEAEKQIEKTLSKQQKQTASAKTKEPKRPQRKSLAK